MIIQAKSILKNVFGYDEFISLQENIIKNILNKKDTLVIMPTGGGKSFCYQIPALVFNGLTIVVSPLISLMKDQVMQLNEFGVSAVVLNSSLPQFEYHHNIEQIKEGKVRLLYIAPESLLKKDLLEIFSSVQVECLAIDEAHCISEWGHNFRPEYRQLSTVRDYFPKAVCVALTATATPRVREDIKASLGFDASNEFVASFDRENLYIQVKPKNNPTQQTITFINKFLNTSGIIYCYSRKQVEDLYQTLASQGFSVRPYHAGLSEKERNENQELFIKDDVQIIVATIAFGMGINKPNVRFVIHFDLPRNIESYYQEIGRAGRDGLHSECLLLFSYADIQKIKYFIDQKNPNEKRVAQNHLSALMRLVETEVCRRLPLLNYFGETYSSEKCNMCDNCMADKKELIDVTIPAQKFLSCIKRTKEIFGAAYIINVLRGSKAKKILNFKHDSLSTYGIGKEFSKEQWFLLSRQLLNKGLIIQDMDYGSLKLTEKAWDVLKGKETVFGRIDIETKKEIPEHTDYDRDLFEILRKERKLLADKVGIPPYVIFSDKTLVEMATFFPQTSNSLMNIHGLGEIKLKKYGTIFLDIIQTYCKKNQIEEEVNKVIKPVSSQKKRHTVIGEIYNSGKSIQEIMQEFKIKQTTVLDHLTRYTQDENVFQYDDFLQLSALSKEQIRCALDAFKEKGPEFLKPIFDALDGKVDYDELKIIRLHYLASNNPKK